MMIKDERERERAEILEHHSDTDHHQRQEESRIGESGSQWMPLNFPFTVHWSHGDCAVKSQREKGKPVTAVRYKPAG